MVRTVQKTQEVKKDVIKKRTNAAKKKKTRTMKVQSVSGINDSRRVYLHVKLLVHALAALSAIFPRPLHDRMKDVKRIEKMVKIKKEIMKLENSKK